jgi:AcrR family transcriptional regulator
MLDRDQHIVSAALSVFARYGVSKTTMNDIAAEAGVARQTLYNAFPGKTELLRAAVRMKMEEGLDQIRVEWAATTDLGARIDSYFAAGPLAWFEAVTTSPELAELLDGMHAVASEELAEGKARWVAFFADAFTNAGLASRDPDISLGEIADFLYTSSKTAKDAAASRADLMARLKVIKQAVIALTEQV